MAKKQDDTKFSKEISGPISELAGDLTAGFLTLTELNLRVWSSGLRAISESVEAIAEQTREIASILPGTPGSQPKLPFKARLFPTPEKGLRVDQFMPERDTPGNVGVCLSGGGSRAMISAMGQLRALKHLGYLGKVKALSSVSGGSWASICFTYLPPEFDEDEFLGTFVENPGDLVTREHRHEDVDPALVLHHLDRGNLGRVAANPEMAPAMLAAQGLPLMFEGVPEDALWCRLVAENVLGVFNLASFDNNELPTSFFTYDEEMAEQLRQENPNLPSTVHVYRQPQTETDVDRPFHLCNTSMFVCPTSAYSEFLPEGGELLVPVHSTAFYTGVMSRPKARDEGRNFVGGGGVSSFAFGSTLEAVDGEDVDVKKRAPFDLSEIAGMSSAFFAAGVMQQIGELDDVVPETNYWPVRDAEPGTTSMNRFADGGDLEDNGVAYLLAYEDVERLIVFINSTEMRLDRHGEVEVDAWLPTLFGYTPHQQSSSKKKAGYFRYKDIFDGEAPMPNDGDLIFQHNQVFPDQDFRVMLDGLWKAAGGESQTGAATFFQQGLEVLENEWFGIRGGRKVDVLWVMLNPASEWVDQLTPDVKKHVPDPFPNYSILDTHLSEVDINLLAHFTSWVVCREKETLAKMFKPGS